MNFDLNSLDTGAGVLAGLGAALIIVAVITILLVIAWLVFYVIGLWKLFEKAGKDGWKAIIPYYNTWTLFEIAGLDWYWFVASAGAPLVATILVNMTGISIFNLIGNIVTIGASVGCCLNLSKKLHKDTSWVVLATIFNGIVIPITGFSKNTVIDNEVVVSKDSYLDKYLNKQQ